MGKQKVTKELHSLLKDVNKSIANEAELVYINSQRTPDDLIKLYYFKLDVLRTIEYSNTTTENLSPAINVIADK